MDARARDLFTAPDTMALPLAEDRLNAVLDPARTIVDLHVFPHRAGSAALVGQRAGKGLRSAIQTALADEVTNHTPLNLLLDDIAGASLVAPWAWSHWSDDWMGKRRPDFDHAGYARIMAGKVDICAGFIAGGTVARAGAAHDGSTGTATGDLRRKDDPLGWHAYDSQSGVGFRRARRIDLWRDGDELLIEAAFQDSATSPADVRQVVHEYTMAACVDAATLTIRTISATPRVLPFPECVTAPLFLDRLVGAPIGTLRSVVLERLRGTAGCTHLNDALRALADVSRLMWPLLQED